MHLRFVNVSKFCFILLHIEVKICMYNYSFSQNKGFTGAGDITAEMGMMSLSGIPK